MGREGERMKYDGGLILGGGCMRYHEAEELSSTITKQDLQPHLIIPNICFINLGCKNKYNQASKGPPSDV